jgi:hypothetical protein
MTRGIRTHVRSVQALLQRGHCDGLQQLLISYNYDDLNISTIYVQ